MWVRFMRGMSLAALLAVLSCAGQIVVGEASAAPRSPELRCSVASGFGFFVAGKRAITCVYYRADGDVEFYAGSITRVGADIGPLNAQQLNFKVRLADPSQPAALQGDFAGASGGVSIGEGASASVLVGGAGGAALTPFDLPNYSGLNISVALGVLSLQYAGREPRAIRERY